MTTDIATLLPTIKILKDEPLSHYSWTKTGGPADFLAFPRSVAETQQLIETARNLELPVTVLGNASNLIVRDGGIRGLTMILTKMDQIKTTDERVIADAGAAYIAATKAAQRAGLTGLEFAAGIPGSVGGGVYMNAGAYGGETAQVLESALVLTEQGELKRLDNAELDFSYRHSAVQASQMVVLQATFRLWSGIRNLIQQEMDHLNYLRKSKQPLEYPSCGSVFKRPKGYFAGKLIHEAGLQGYQSGGAAVSRKHAGFIVNVNQATATDYLNVIAHVQQTVYNQTGVKLETEVRVIGVEPE
ncbi:UDP-N-acetylenolpyruvoylglucosamine reductase [Fructilactobacillus florum 8D]|uniref:UDP-N-acetylenolpyruvoylglucosamine reductase n=1 Tax=Fructilactobacillus florum 8D TaxID=1221538 RepID=W9EH40_9LACO|nr:UDP-N-acetylmuramate dehydrogenase [Fructilactobacillus florum]EKK20510.1 UDP-N-acetylenolpyruvoylglucosamine reductase [Fructilactobacillus florum 2F]ETO40335.1 UDP-N-acetylenolpyruvoylglucosamine reductase [Fructilactobacillus florum 8D]